MIKYQENRNDITQSVEIDLTEIPAQSRGDLESKITEYLKYKDKSIFRFDAGDKLVYETEILISKVNKNRLNILMVLGNPAVHSVAERMFFSYERTPTGKMREHRFWRALRECKVLKFNSDLGKPTPQNIEKINACKRDWLLNGKYDSDFNIFLLPYFSFPTPASGKCSGVAGIKKILGKEIFEEMKEFEFQRFKDIISYNNIENVLCFQKSDVLKEIRKWTKCEQAKSILNDPNYPVYKIDIALKHVTLYTVPPTRRLHINKYKEILRNIVAGIKVKNRIV